MKQTIKSFLQIFILFSLINWSPVMDVGVMCGKNQLTKVRTDDEKVCR